MIPANKPSIVDAFVKRPILALVVCVVLVLAGLRAAQGIAVLQFPRIESATLVISTIYTGASSDVVQGFVTEPIERVAATIPGVDYVDSNTTAGVSTVRVWLQLNHSTTAALAELSSRLSQIRFELPQGAEDPSVEVQRADRPAALFYLDVVADNIPRAQVTDYLKREVNPMIAAIDGVQRVGLEGGREPAMRIWLDPAKLRAFDLSASDVLAALRGNNVIATVGHTENAWQRINLLANTTLQTTDDFRQLVLREDRSALLRLGDVARIELAEEEGEVNARYSQRDNVFISVWPLPGANEIAIGDALYPLLDDLNRNMPAGIRIEGGYDGTIYMRDALREIFTTLSETILLVGLVVLALMGSFRTALVPLLTIPISILGAIACMAMMGFSLNLLTTLAIVLSVGLVVDDAIVVVENVARHMREGLSRTEAALVSSRELLTPIITMTLTLAAVYAPIGFLSGLSGVLFKEFAFTLAIAVLISGVVAITLAPIMSAKVTPEGGHEGRITHWVNERFDRLHYRYAKILDRLFLWQGQILVMALIFSLLAVPFMLFSQKELAPIEDEGMLSVVVEAPPEASLDYTSRQMHDVVDALLTLPGSTRMWQVVRSSGGFGGLEFKPFVEREHTVQDLLFPAFDALSGVEGVKAFPILPPSLPSAGQFDVEMVIQSPDSYRAMKAYADKMVQAAYASGNFMFAETDLKIDLTQVKLDFDRDRIADLGMTLASVNDQIATLLSGNYANRFDANGRAHRVIPMVQDADRIDPETMLDLLLQTPSGELVPVSAIATLSYDVAPRVLGKFDQKRSFRLFGGITPGSTKEQALSVLEKAAADLLPPQYSVDYAGESRQIRKEGNTLIAVLGIALVLVYLMLAVQFNSLRDPLVVLLGSVPLAISGALLFPFLSWTSINIYSQIGFITLVGLVAKNGILIVEFANQAQKRGARKLEAIRMAAETRLRPVLMTTAATVLGHFPLVLVTGAGAEARNSIGIILVSGMLIGTFFTLVVLPCMYLWLAEEHEPEGLDSPLKIAPG
ncbi:efflux RND transporter permease subunit [Litorivivens sp.]|uniref:efflux RND transporter permease subunit n=1 Tax=Litorivivens sp. TaxID=2020868 RepID=UPI0035639F8E